MHRYRFYWRNGITEKEEETVPISRYKYSLLENDFAFTRLYTTVSFIKFFLFAHLKKIESLHALNTELAEVNLQRELGLESISVSQLSRENRDLDSDLLSSVFLELVQLIHTKTNMKKRHIPVKIINSSTMLNLTRCNWATFRKTKAGVKLHLRLVYVDQDTMYPKKATIKLPLNMTEINLKFS